MKATTTEELLKIIVNAIQDKKGEDIRVVAIAQSVGDKCREMAGEKPVGVNGLGTDQWVAIDFVDIIVHIFLPEPREFYDLEHLWEDANISIIKEGESL